MHIALQWEGWPPLPYTLRKKGYSAVPVGVGKPFEEPFLCEFYMEPKQVFFQRVLLHRQAEDKQKTPFSLSESETFRSSQLH